MTKRPHHKLPRGPRRPGMCRDAADLDVSRQHLHAVLTGRRVSASLMRRYPALTRNRGAAV